MRITAINKLFGDEFGDAVTETLKKKPTYQLDSCHIPVSFVVEACFEQKRYEGIYSLFKTCTEKLQSSQSVEQRRIDQLKEAAKASYEILQEGIRKNCVSSQIQTFFQTIQEVYNKIFPIQSLSSVVLAQTKSALEQAFEWCEGQKLSIADLLRLCDNPDALEPIIEKTKMHADAVVKEMGFTTKDAGTHLDKTLHGKPFDQNRLGRLPDGKDVLGFEGFYIAGSEVPLSHRAYDLMQAPLTPNGGKVDTVKDFWDTVVVMRRSPIIVTVHDPQEKIVKCGYPERASYWTPDRFTPAMSLRNGWEIKRKGDDQVILCNEHFPRIKLIKRSFTAENSSTKETHEVTQFHYQGWPDHLGVPDHELFLKLIEAVEQEFKQKNILPRAPITTHCAAGMGRSPTFCVAHNLICDLQEQLRQGKPIDEIRIDLVGSIFKVRTSRPSTLGGKAHWESILYALRRYYLQQKAPDTLLDVKVTEIITEMQTLIQAAKNDAGDLKKLQDRIQASSTQPTRVS